MWDKTIFYLGHISCIVRQFLSQHTLSLVTAASLAAIGRGDCPGVLVLPLFPDVSGKHFPVTRSTYSERAGTKGDLNGSLSLRAASYVFRHGYLFCRDAPLAGIGVRSPHWADSCGRNCMAGGDGRAYAAEGTVRLCSLYDPRKISSHPTCLVRNNITAMQGRLWSSC